MRARVFVWCWYYCWCCCWVMMMLRDKMRKIPFVFFSFFFVFLWRLYHFDKTVSPRQKERFLSTLLKCISVTLIDVRACIICAWMQCVCCACWKKRDRDSRVQLQKLILFYAYWQTHTCMYQLVRKQKLRRGHKTQHCNR